MRYYVNIIVFFFRLIDIEFYIDNQKLILRLNAPISLKMLRKSTFVVVFLKYDFWYTSDIQRHTKKKTHT